LYAEKVLIDLYPQVTLIRSLQSYGIDPQEFAHNIQIKAACSTSGNTVHPPPANKQLFTEVEVNCGGYLPSCEAAR